MKWIYDLSYEELKEDILALNFTRYTVDQVFSWLYRKINPDIDTWSNINKKNREILKKTFDTRLIQVEDTRIDRQGTAKFLMRLRDGLAVESVLMKEKDHYTFCLSSQVGCPLGCVFCATGKMGFLRNLSSGEILSQILLMRRYLGHYRGKLNVVFMGMGEPLLNEENLAKSLKIISSASAMGLSPRNITLSTAGILERLKRFEENFPRIKLSFSLNAPDEKTRKALMPISIREPLSDILDHFRTVHRKHRITMEYVMIQGINDRPEDAGSVARMLKHIACKINIIPLNPVEGSDLKAPDKKRIDEFSEVLRSRGYTVMVRWSKGRDIRSACGQLAVAGRAGKNR